MLLKNKLTQKALNIFYSEFRKRFERELQIAFENYRQT